MNGVGTPCSCKTCRCLSVTKITCAVYTMRKSRQNRLTAWRGERSIFPIISAMLERADSHRETEADEPRIVDRAADDRVSVERTSVSAELTLMSLTEQEFTTFYLRCFYADHSPQGGVSVMCPWFPRVAHLFTGKDGNYLSEEVARAAGRIARQRGLVLSSEGPPPGWSYFAASSKPVST